MPVIPTGEQAAACEARGIAPHAPVTRAAVNNQGDGTLFDCTQFHYDEWQGRFSFGCGDGDSNPNALRRQNDNPLYRLIPAAAGQNTEHKVCQPASVVSEFGSPLNGENSILKHRFRRLEKGGQHKYFRQKSTTFGMSTGVFALPGCHDKTMKPDISPW
jgi:hypothetical protein